MFSSRERKCFSEVEEIDTAAGESETTISENGATQYYDPYLTYDQGYDTGVVQPPQP